MGSGSTCYSIVMAKDDEPVTIAERINEAARAGEVFEAETREEVARPVKGKPGPRSKTGASKRRAGRKPRTVMPFDL